MAKINRLYPRLVVADAAAAIDFYRAALGAEESVRYTGPDGKIVHAEVTIAGTTVAVKDEGDGDRGPGTLGGTPVIIELLVDDADTVAQAMVRHGAKAIFPVDDREYGERDGRVADPYGHLWIVSQRIEELSPDEVQHRVTTMYD